MRRTFFDVCHHAGYHVMGFLGDKETQNLNATSRACQAISRKYVDQYCLSLPCGHQWARLVRQLARVRSLRVFPNSLAYFHASVKARYLVTLNLSSCGLTHKNVRVLGLVKGLRKAANVRHLCVSENPCLETKGLGALLKALDTAGAVLQSLSAANTGLRRVWPTDQPLAVLAQLRSLDVTQNTLGEVTHDRILRHTCFEKLAMDLNREEVRQLVHRGHIAAHLATFSRLAPTDTRKLFACGWVVALSLRSGVGVQWDRLGASLTRLSLVDMDMSDAGWQSLLEEVALNASLTELVCSRAKNLGVRAIVNFVAHHRQPSVFTSLCVHNDLRFTYDDLTLVCRALDDKGCQLRSWTLSNCLSLYFPACAQDFIQTLSRTQHVHLDIGTSIPVVGGRRDDEAQWIDRVLTCGATFSFLGLDGRCVVMSDPTRAPDLFQHVEQMSLDKAEINWGFRDSMVRLKTLSIIQVDLRHVVAEQALQQILCMPCLRQLRVEHGRYENAIDFPAARYLNVLNLNWCSLGPGFRHSLLHALVQGKFPALSTFRMLNTNPAQPSFVCLWVLAMKNGGRNCDMDVRGHAWTVCQLKFVCTSLRQLRNGDVSRLRLTVPPEAQEQLVHMRGLFPTIVLR